MAPRHQVVAQGSEWSLSGVCIVKNTFVHVEEQSPFARKRSGSMPASREVCLSSPFLHAKTIDAFEEQLSPRKRNTNLEAWKKCMDEQEQDSSDMGSQGGNETPSVDTCDSTTPGTPPTSPILYTSAHEDFNTTESRYDYAQQENAINPNMGFDAQTCNVAGSTHVRVDPVSWEDNVLTVMMRKIPQFYTQRMLLDRVVERGFGAQIDFLYLPFDYCKRKNVGYGFVNFIDPKYALAFRDAFDETFLDDQTHLRCKQVRVHPASLQGFDANWQHFRRTKTGQKQDPEYSPLFFPSPMSSQMIDEDADTRLPQTPPYSTLIAPGDSQQLSISNSNTPSAKSWRWETEEEAEDDKEAANDFLLDKLRWTQEAGRKPRPRADRRHRRNKNELEPSPANTPASEGRKSQQRTSRAGKDQQHPVARRNWRRGLGKAGATGNAAS